MSLGYLLTSFSNTYATVFLSLILMVTGAGFFKPIISGTIARSFLFPLIFVPLLKSIGWSYIFIMAAVGTGWLLFLNLFAYKEPTIPKSNKSLIMVFKEMVLVLKDYKFILMIVVYSGFWVL